MFETLKTRAHSTLGCNYTLMPSHNTV